MAIEDISLDDMIKRNKAVKQAKAKTAKGGGGMPKAKAAAGKKTFQNKATAAKQTTDVRNKIIQKNRQKFHDARDRLVAMAKTGDARAKLNRIKGKTTGIQTKKHLANTKPLTKVITQKVTAAPSKKLVAERSKMVGSSLRRTITGSGRSDRNPALRSTKRKELPVKPLMVSTVNENYKRKSSPSRRYRPLRNNPTVVTINNDKMYNNRPLRSQRSSMMHQSGAIYDPAQPLMPAPSGRPLLDQPFPPQLHYRDYMPSSRSHGMQQMPFISQTEFGSNFAYSGSPELRSSAYGSPWNAQSLPPQYGGPRDAWDGGQMRQPDPARLRITTTNNMMANEQIYAPQRSLPQKRSLVDTPSYMQNRKKVAGASAVGRLGKRVAPTPAGHKIIVSSLQSTVSLDDIQELFGNIGTLKSVRMLNPGTAEVLFHKADDARRSVMVYHNRKLDGKPMTVKYVLHAGATSATAAPKAQSVLKSARGRYAVY